MNRVSSLGRRFSVSFTSWFCLPEQGMKDMEVLSRGSAFLIPTLNRNGNDFKAKYHVCTAAHIVSPWLFPTFYPDEWLTHVNHTHTHYTMEIRYDDGTFVFQHEFLPEAFLHNKRDLAVLHLENEKECIEILDDLKYNFLPLKTEKINVNDKLLFAGHNVTGLQNEVNGEDERKPEPTLVNGSFVHRTPHQSFAKSDIVLTDGMCGGSVVSGDEKELIGMIEGIVPHDSEVEGLRDHVVYVDGHEITEFLIDIEDNNTESEKHKHFIGGEAAKHVGADQDPEKLDWHKYMLKNEE